MEWHEVFKGVRRDEVPAAVFEEEERERAGLFRRFRKNLGRARSAVAEQLKAAIYVGVDRRLYEQVEEALIAADVGVDGTVKVVDELERRCTAKKIEAREPFLDELADVIAEVLQPDDPEQQRIDVSAQPTVILVVGVNGTGKTTTIGKIAWRLKEMGKTAADGGGRHVPRRGRAAAHRVGQPRRLRDRASRRRAATPRRWSTTAWRPPARAAPTWYSSTPPGVCTRRSTSCASCEKVRRVIEKQLPGAPHETLLVLDATTGQNGLRQAQEFQQAVDVSGVVLTKLDGTAKGGIVVAIHETLRHPHQAHRRGRAARRPAAVRGRRVRTRDLRR